MSKLYSAEEIRAAMAWLLNSNKTVDAARQALRDMGFVGGNYRSEPTVERADYWARVIVEDAERSA